MTPRNTNGASGKATKDCPENQGLTEKHLTFTLLMLTMTKVLTLVLPTRTNNIKATTATTQKLTAPTTRNTLGWIGWRMCKSTS